MNSIITFLLISFFLAAFATFFIIPWFRNNAIRIGILGFIFAFSLVLYLSTGGATRQQQLASLNNDSEWEFKQLELRRLMHTFKKQEFKLRHHLSDQPNDKEAEYRLLDLMAIKALQQGDSKTAIELWKETLKKIPNQKSTENMRHRIQTTLNSM